MRMKDDERELAELVRGGMPLAEAASKLNVNQNRLQLITRRWARDKKRNPIVEFQTLPKASKKKKKSSIRLEKSVFAGYTPELAAPGVEPFPIPSTVEHTVTETVVEETEDGSYIQGHEEPPVGDPP